MKLLLVGDLHLRAKKLKDVSNAWASAVNWAHKNDVDLIIQAGDVFDHANVYGREASTGTIYTAFLDPFSVQDRPRPLFVIPGNHDIGSPKDRDALSPVDKYPWINVIRKPSVVEVNDQLAICAVPWINRIHLISRLLTRGMKVEEATLKVNSVIAQLMTPLSAQIKKEQDAGRFVLFVGHLEITGAKLTGSFQHGGSFEFSSANLKSAGADAYALAHIHVRQHIDELPNPNDGYLGCLCQLNFGEEGNDVGCRFIEIQDRKIVQDRWLDNKSSPRYFTATNMEGLVYRPAFDYVKYRGKFKPDTLPEGIIFEKVPENAEVRLRTDQKLDCDMPLKTLLSAWKDVTNCPIDLDLLIETADKLSRSCQGQSEAIGSLEQIERIVLKNITCHGNTEIKTSVNGICGLAGPNGSGKTTAIEAIMLALYGISPSRGSIQALLPKGESIESAVELEYLSGGKRYLTRREFTKTKKAFGHKAYVFDITKEPYIKDKSKPIEKATGPDGVFAFNSNLVGDSDLVLAGIFSSQGDSGNLVKLKPTARKDLFAKLLGTEKFICISEAAKKIGAADFAAIEAQNKRLESVNIALAAEATDKADLIEAQKQLEKKTVELEETQHDLEKIVNDLSDIEHKKSNRDAVFKSLQDLLQKKAKVKENGVSLKQEKLTQQALSKENIDQEIAETKAAKQEAEEISLKIAEISQQTLKHERELNELKNTRDNEYKTLADKVQLGKNKLDNLNSKLEEANRRTSLLKGFPDLPACQTCPLAKDSIESRNTIPAIEGEVDSLKQKIGKAESLLQKHKEDTSKQIEKTKKDIPDDVPQTLLERRAGLLKKGNELPALEEKQAKISNAKAEIKKLDALIDAAKKNYVEIEAQEKEIVIPQFDEEAWKKKVSDKAELQATIKTINHDISAINVRIGSNEAKLEQHAARKKEAESIKADIKQKHDDSAVYDALTKACGRDGIPQLIVDSAMPHLQDIMFDMMSEIDGKWTIRVATQRETGKGTIQERIDILVDDGEDERDISTYSGGEMNLLSTIIRIAFSILQAERSGKGLKVLVLDEAMYFADHEYSDAFMRMLKKLPKYFNQIFVISHSEFVLSSIQDKIFFARTTSGKTTVQTDFATKV